MQFWRPIFKTFLLQRRPSFLLPWIIANTFQSGTNLVETIYLLGLNTVSQSPIQKFDNPFHLLSGAERAKRAEPHLTWRLSSAIWGKLSKWARAKRAIEI